jgi:electron transport complex protein RnfB
MVFSAVITLGGLALLFSFLLAVAGKKFAVKIDPKQEMILKILPGSNCGICGFAGCTGMAEVLIRGEVGAISCPVVSEEIIYRIGEILGKKFEVKEVKVAQVMCQGNDSKVKYDYKGVEDCSAAHLLAGGYKACSYACLGLGSCKEVCPFDAIRWEKGKTPEILMDKCIACGKCVEVCPTKVISLIPKKAKVYVKCSSLDKGARVRKICNLGCIACGICIKVCEPGAIKIENNLAIIDYEKCTNCGICVEKCPTKSIVMVE